MISTVIFRFPTVMISGTFPPAPDLSNGLLREVRSAGERLALANGPRLVGADSPERFTVRHFRSAKGEPLPAPGVVRGEVEFFFAK